MLLLLLAGVFLSGCGSKESDLQQKKGQLEMQETSVEVGRIGDDIPVTRGQAAKMIALAFYTPKELEQLPQKAAFDDVDEAMWCYPYINGAVQQGFLLGDGENFAPNDFLTLKQAEELMERLNPDHKTSIKLTEENQDKPVAYSLWMQVYQEALSGRRAEESLYSYGIMEKQLIPLEVTEKGVLTSEGQVQAQGYELLPYIGRGVTALVKEKEVVGLLEVTSQQPVLENICFQVTEAGLAIYTGGGTFLLTEGTEKLQPGELCVGDIQVDGRKFLSMGILENQGKDKIKKVTEEEIELGNKGVMTWDDNARVYEENGNIVARRSPQRLLCGTEIADFYIKDETVKAAVIRRKPEIKDIRVVLSPTGQQGYYHEDAIFVCEQAMTLEGNGKKIEITPGQEINLKAAPYAEMMENRRVMIKGTQGNTPIQVKSVMREGVNPSYRGTIEVEKTPQGFVLVNELPLEEYLKGVVPGEMPTSFGLEALKVQAVAARSYAYNQYFANRYAAYGAHVDDTTNCQVYKGVVDDAVSDEAVTTTEGVCLTYGNKVINANFFSTSAGYTSNSGEVWYDFDKNIFPAENKPYLISKPQGLEKDYGDLTQGKEMGAFIRNQEIESYDGESPWYRWKVTMPWEQVKDIINRGINDVWSENQILVEVLQEDHTWKSAKPAEFSQISEIIIEQRGEGGLAMVLEITGDNQSIRIKTEYAIRKVLRPVKAGEGLDIPLALKDGTERMNFGILPSAFISLELQYTKDGTIDALLIYGGGSGHGAGMSQYGAKGMADKGFTYDEILEHYFQGAKAQKAI